MAAAAVVEFQRAQSLISTDRDASIDILHSIGRFSALNSNVYILLLNNVLPKSLVLNDRVSVLARSRDP